MLDLAKIADLVLTSTGIRDSSHDAQGTSQFVSVRNIWIAF